MQLTKNALNALGADEGAGSVVTKTEFGDSQVTFAEDEKAILFKIIPPTKIGRGPIEKLGRRAEQEFIHFEGLKKRDRIKLNVNYPKDLGNETRLYLRRDSFKPSAGNVWFIFVRSTDKALCLSSLSPEDFAALQKGVLSPQPVLEEAADRDEKLDPAEILERVERSILARRGQAKFRSSLRKKFNDKCCVTGSQVVAVLEAAHIALAKGKDINNESNGLLLRSDIHTIFDLQLLAIDPDNLKVITHPSLKGTEYEKYNGKKLVSETKVLESISKDSLRARWDSLPWTPNS